MSFSSGPRHECVDAHRLAGWSEAARVQLLAVADHPVDLGHRRIGRWIYLRRAAGDDNLGVRAPAARTADRLPCLTLGLGGDGAGIDDDGIAQPCRPGRSEEHTSELQSLMRISYAVFCLKKKKI